MSQENQGLTPHNSGGIPASASAVKMANILITSFTSKDLHKDVSVKQSSDVAMVPVGDEDGSVAGGAAGRGAGTNDPDLKEFHASSQFMKRNDALFCFKYLVVYIAALMSFAHGANDTANSTATFSAVYTAYKDGLSNCDAGTEIWILVVAGASSSLGTILLGYKVIRVAFCIHRGDLAILTMCLYVFRLYVLIRLSRQ